MIERLMRLWTLCFLILLDPAFAVERITLEVGHVHDLELAPDLSLRLSQKRVVEIEEVKRGSFRLLALRSGTVSLRAIDPQGEVQHLYLLEVLPRPTGVHSRLLWQEPWDKYFCREEGVFCDRDNVRIAGSSRSLRWLHAARRQCEKLVPCCFEVRLAAEAQRSWAETLARELDQGPFGVAEDGFVRLQGDCATISSSDREQLRRTILERYGAPFLFECRKTKAEAWVLEILALAQRSQRSDLDNPLQWELPPLPAKAPLQAVIQGLNQDGRVTILARPDVLLTLGSEVSIRDGLEIQTLLPEGDKPSSVWKPVGFNLNCRLLEHREGRAKLAMEIELSRARVGAQSLDSSSLQTQAWIMLEKWQRMGRIRARTDGDETSGIPILRDIPWLGALFRWNLEQKAASDVWLFVRLRPASLEEQDPYLSLEAVKDSGADDRGDSSETEPRDQGSAPEAGAQEDDQSP